MSQSPDLKLKKGIILGLILTAVFTLPVVFHLFGSIPGRGADTYQAFARTIMIENKIRENGFWNTLVWQKNQTFWGILPLIGYTQALFGSFLGYNLWWLASFFLAFLGTWLFLRENTDSDWAALLGGFVFAFSPFHFSQALATNIGTMHYEWVAWLVFFLFRFFRNFSWKNALGVAVVLFLIVTTEHQLLAFVLLFLLFLLPYLGYLHPKIFFRWQFWLTTIVGISLVVTVGAFQFKKLWEIAHSSNNYLKPPYSQVEDYSADGIDFLIPPRFGTLLGEKFNYLRKNLASNAEGRQSFYLGYFALFLAIWGMVKIFSKKGNFSSKEKRVAIFFFFVTVFFIILSLGPTLHFRGERFLEKSLPYLWLYKFVPYWDFIRTTSRIFLISLFGFSVLVAFGAKSFETGFETTANFLKRILRKTQDKNPIGEVNAKSISPQKTWAAVFAGVILLGLPVDYLSLPIITLDTAYSPFYNKIKEEKEGYAILEIPGSTSYDFASYSMYTAQIHEKTKVDGMDFARSQKDIWTFQKNTPVINTLLYSLPSGGKYNPEEKSSDIIITDYTPWGKSILNFYNIRYLTLSKVKRGERFTSETEKNVDAFIQNVLGIPLFYEDNFLKAYKVPLEKRSGHFLSLETQGEEWGEKEGGGKSRGRWARSGARMKMVNLGDKPINIDLKFKAKIAYLRRLEILFNGQTVKKIFLQEFEGNYTVALNQIPPGENFLEFKITDQDGNEIKDETLSRGIRFSQVETAEK